MPSDTSRRIFDKRKHYSAVQLQQGRVLLDSDWNEQIDIGQYRTQTQANDVIGKCGVPKKSNAFEISINAAKNNFDISPGRIYVGGLLCELDSKIFYPDQPYYPNISNLDLQDGTYIIYIKAWQREITFLDDPLIQEVALGEADTTTRLQTVWQVRLRKAEDDLKCEATSNVWNQITAFPTGKLKAKPTNSNKSDSPCILPPNAGYKRIENQLYRVEIHNGSDGVNPSFKWSRDNASVETGIEGIRNNFIKVESVGKDHILGFAEGQWVEIVDEESTLNFTPQKLVKIIKVYESIREIEVDFNGGRISYKEGQKLRRWDQNNSADENGVPISSGWVDVEGGIQIQFSSGSYNAGDYWLIPARTVTANIEWPLDGSNNPVAQAPQGIHTSFCKLAIIKVENKKLSLKEDCRPVFPTLTEICAEDICYDNGECDLTEANTVQDALDELCQKRDNSCTFIVLPKPGWENVFKKIKKHKDAQICFQVGKYPLSKTVKISSKGNLKFNGAGFGTKIIAKNSEAALIFEDCKSVIMRDLYAETGKVGFNASENHLNGTLTFLNCSSINIDTLKLKCGSGASRSATCITVRNQVNKTGDVSILNTVCNVGHYQQGILLVNAKKAHIENNSIKVYKKPRKLTFQKQMEDKRFRSEMNRWLISSEKSIGIIKKTNVELSFDNFKTPIKTHGWLTGSWVDVLDKNPPANIKSEEELLTYLKNLGNKLLIDAQFRKPFIRVNDLVIAIAKQESSVASQGITVGGRKSEDIRILNNTLAGMLQGIHVGLSHQKASNVPIPSNNVTIAGNSILNILPPTVNKSERYGIFVGNCNSLIIENNNLKLERDPEHYNTRTKLLTDHNDVFIEGIRVWGAFGNRLIITRNCLSDMDGLARNSYDVGIRVQPLTTRPNIALWLVNQNVLPAKINSILKSNGVKVNNNTP